VSSIAWVQTLLNIYRSSVLTTRLYVYVISQKYQHLHQVVLYLHCHSKIKLLCKQYIPFVNLFCCLFFFFKGSGNSLKTFLAVCHMACVMVTWMSGCPWCLKLGSVCMFSILCDANDQLNIWCVNLGMEVHHKNMCRILCRCYFVHFSCYSLVKFVTRDVHKNLYRMFCANWCS
jgi:hypothetical protein